MHLCIDFPGRDHEPEAFGRLPGSERSGYGVLDRRQAFQIRCDRVGVLRLDVGEIYPGRHGRRLRPSGRAPLSQFECCPQKILRFNFSVIST